LKDRGRLTVSCSDGPGIVASVSQFLFQQGANIVHSDQHSTDHTGGRFFMRLEFDLEDLAERLPVLDRAFEPVARAKRLEYRFVNAATRPRLAVFATKEEHCLVELLWHIRAGDIQADVALVVSNHRDLESTVRPFGIPFHCIPVDPGQKTAAEALQLRLVGNADLVVLAKYMQILSPEFIAKFPNRIVNIHHSFLPAFVGANPYKQAHLRGVKIIGATAHYVTEELDAGPIIEQDVHRVDHRAEVPELRRIGRQIERAVLARAVKWHVEDRVFVHEGRTVVF
jgi:formyltetrahydrofolate deformylase